MEAGSVRILGLGNVLMGDDAAGPWVIETLSAGWSFPETVSLTDVGTPGLDLTPYLAGADTVIIVDTVKADGPPGQIRLYSLDQLLAMPAQPRLSPHDPGLAEALFALSLAGTAPREVTLVGIVPGSVERGIGVTGAVRRAVDLAAAEVIDRVERLGLAPIRRSGRPVTPWWESRPDGSGALSASSSD